MIFLFSILFSLASATPSIQLDGKFQISGFSFGGRIPGEVYLGENDEIHFQLLRPSGLSIMSVTYTATDVCFLFDFDNVQYKGTPEEFAAITNGAIVGADFQHIFAPNTAVTSSWQWKSSNNQKKLRKGTIYQNQQELLEVQFNQWKRNNPTKISVHVLENDWRMKATIQKRKEVDWNFSCETPNGMETLPFHKMVESVQPQKKNAKSKEPNN